MSCYINSYYNAEQFRPKAVSQLTKWISRFFVPLLPVWHADFSIRLNDLVVALASVKSVIALSLSTADTFLQYFHKIPDIFE